MSRVVDIAEVLEVVPPTLPAMVSARELIRNPYPAPPQIVQGVLHQGSKLLLSGTSKSNKSWSLLDLAVSVASGQKWWGHRCGGVEVALLNFELAEWAMRDRLGSVLSARPECGGCEDRLLFWNLRGHNADLTVLRPRLEEELCRRQFGLIIIDPIYKLLGDRDENSNGEIAGLMNEVEAFCQKFGAAVAIAHHFAKGDSTGKNAIDRMSGAGVWARDPDSLVTLTPHEEEDCFSVNMTLRNLPRMPEFVVRWDYPLMKLAPELNPDALRRPQARNKVCTDREFVEAVLGEGGKAHGTVIRDAANDLGMSRATAARYLQRLVSAGLVHSSGGLYWKQTGGVEG
jgi:hypothetical protein